MPRTEPQPTVFSIPTLSLLTPLCILGALIGTETVTRLGVTPNTALLGALSGMALARLPGAVFARFAAPRLHSLAQGAIAAASFGAGQALLLPIGIPFLLGRTDLVGPLFAGVFLALLVDGWLAYRLFGSPALPANAAWPAGAATGEVIRAGHEGGRDGAILVAGMVLGAVGAAYRAPMAAFAVAFIGNPWALGSFALGLLLRGHAGSLFGGDLMRAQIPQGIMVGAAMVALAQVLWTARGDGVRRAVGMSGAAYLAIAMLLAVAGGLHGAMAPAMLVLFIVYAALVALLHGVIVGLAAMHSGWLPAFAVALIALVGGLLIGFPAPALCLLVGFAAATGPGFAAMGYGLKSSDMLGGGGAGRRQQFLAGMFGFAVAGAVVWLGQGDYFAAGRVAPVGWVFVTTIQTGVAPGAGGQLALWAVAGAALQLAGGSGRQLGVLLATGLLLMNPAAGWAVLLGLGVRVWFTRRTRGTRRAEMAVFAAGMIAGDALANLADAANRTLSARR